MHLQSVGIRTLWHALILFALVQNGLDRRGQFFGGRVGVPGVTTTMVGNKGRDIPKIAIDGIALDGFTFDGIPLGQIDCVSSHDCHASSVAHFFQEVVVFWPS